MCKGGGFDLPSILEESNKIYKIHKGMFELDSTHMEIKGLEASETRLLYYKSTQGVYKGEKENHKRTVSKPTQATLVPLHTFLRKDFGSSL